MKVASAREVILVQSGKNECLHTVGTDKAIGNSEGNDKRETAFDSTLFRKTVWIVPIVMTGLLYALAH